MINKSSCVLGLLYLLVSCVQHPDNTLLLEPDEFTEDKIGGGRLAKKNEFPSIVALIKKDTRMPFCTGTLIGKKTVLTAAHCLDVFDITDFLIATQTLDPFRTSSVDYEVMDVLKHEKFLLNTKEENTHDIGLVFLNHEVENVPLITLSRSESEGNIGEKIILAGFGDVLEEDGDTRGALHTITLKANPCKEYEENVTSAFPFPDESLICVYGKRNRGTKNGDSGGPGMIKSQRGELIQVSTTMSGILGDKYRKHSALVRVSQHYPWITEHMNPPS